MSIKLHIGSGTIFLDGWVNVDMAGAGVFLAQDKPDLVSKYKTTEEDYYANHQDQNVEKMRLEGPQKDDYVCDKYGSWERIPCGLWEADEVLGRQSFEHLSISEARKALDEVDRVLKPGGILRIDVPDHEASFRKYRETGDEFYVRHCLGTRKNDHGYHVQAYTRETLRNLVEEFGFIFLEEEKNIHFYPAFCLKFVKPQAREPRRYALHGIAFNPNWLVADLGPGHYPLERADVYIDNDDRIISALRQMGKQGIVADLNKLPLPIEDKTFDYLFCSHVLEHVDDPVNALRELSRIAKRGCIVLPNAFKEFLFLFEEDDHLWWSLPPRVPGGAIGFIYKDENIYKSLYNVNVSKTMVRLFRSGPNRLDHDARLLRRWYYEKENSLDVIVHWEGEVKGIRIW